ncbi:MAG: DNA adenine methylase [Candidatus Heimdallarchaeaceae archaeon]
MINHELDKTQAPHSFFPYIGNKHRHIKKFLSLVPKHDLFIELFGGSGSFIFNKPPSHHEIYNDINGDLTNLFWVTAFRYSQFLDILTRLPLHSRGIFKKFKSIDCLKSNFDIDIDIELFRAVRTFYMLWNSFSGNGLLSNASFSAKGQQGSTRRGKTTSLDSLNTLQYFHARLQEGQVCIEQQDFSKLLEKYNYEDVFVYADPPYFELEQYYAAPDNSLHMRLFNKLKDFKGYWMLSYNDVDFIRNLYGDYTILEVKLFYTAALKNNSSLELLILNYNPEEVELAFVKNSKLTDFLGD